MLDFNSLKKSLRYAKKIYHTEDDAFFNLIQTENIDCVQYNHCETILVNTLNFINEKNGKNFIEIDVKKISDAITDFSFSENIELFLVLGDILIPTSGTQRDVPARGARAATYLL
jgi:hypothetical protein